MIIVNKVTLSGKLAAEAESIPTATGNAMAKFTLAAPVGYGEHQHIANFEIKTFKKNAETILQYGKKGKEILVDGSLDVESWSKDGKDYHKLTILANNISFGTVDRTEQASAAPKTASKPAATTRPRVAAKPAQQAEEPQEESGNSQTNTNSVSNGFDDDVPF